MGRGQFFKIGTVVTANQLGGASCSTTPTESKPNVILIYVDDMGVGLPSAYGQQQYTHLKLDKPIDEGKSFSHAYGAQYQTHTGYSGTSWDSKCGLEQQCVAITAPPIKAYKSVILDTPIS